MKAPERAARFKLGDKLTLMYLLFCLMLCGDAFGASARETGVKAFGVPFSPGSAVFFAAFTLIALFNVWLSNTTLKVGEGWVETACPWGSARLSLNGARVVLTRFYGFCLIRKGREVASFDMKDLTLVRQYKREEPETARLVLRDGSRGLWPLSDWDSPVETKLFAALTAKGMPVEEQAWVRRQEGVFL